ncbi:MAG TPA: DUF6491 family protein [Gammaproteobacteria bacterium]|nr:DUF6491 family protein [Gammaproteobacteria bacterium]
MTIGRYCGMSILAICASCATQPVDPNRPISPACDQSASCFYERNIRSFQVLDDRTIIVLVGRNQCPYKLELDGFFCDVSMSAFLGFDDQDGRICTWDRTIVVGGPFARDTDYCRLRQVTPMTDDELLEAYATKGLTQPLPAKGSGVIEVEESPPTEEGAESSPAEAPSAPVDAPAPTPQGEQPPA